MENYVPVLTRNKRPLAPCHPTRAKSLVAQGKATFKYRYGIRCIILHKSNVPKVKRSSRLTLQINPGSRTTGLAITRDNQDGSRSCLITAELHHRGKSISKKLIKRSQKRSTRRGRKTRFRQPRFTYRKRPEGWLPPSIRSRYQNTLTWVNRLSRLLAISDINVETSKFDPQLLRNPDIRGEEYQKGPLYRTNLKAAVLERDGNKCAYCGRSGRNRKLEMEHIVPKDNGGSDRYDNRVPSCEECNRAKDNMPLEVFLKRRPKKLAEIQAKMGMDLSDPTHMNMIIPRLLKELREQGWTVGEESAATTVADRILCNLPKSHANDAAVTGCPKSLSYIMDSGPAPFAAKEGLGDAGYHLLRVGVATPREQGTRANPVTLIIVTDGPVPWTATPPREGTDWTPSRKCPSPSWTSSQSRTRPRWSCTSRKAESSTKPWTAGNSRTSERASRRCRQGAPPTPTQA